MSAKDLLDYGALGLAGLMGISAIGFARWISGRAFDMMREANQAFKAIATLATTRQSEQEEEEAD